MKKIHLLAIAGCACLMWGATGCQQADSLPPEDGKARTVKVNIAAGTAATTEAPGTRATAPYTPEVENLIHDIWVVQFNDRGQRLTLGQPYHDRAGSLYVDNFEVELVVAENSTVCLVANTSDGTLTWPDNLPAFRETLLPIGVDNELKLDRMPMCGYWQGDVTTEGQVLSVLLCRMMTRINLVLNNETGAAITDPTVTLTGIPAQAYVYPRLQQTALPDEAYLSGNFEDRLTGTTLKPGDSQELYYYIAPNICTNETHATKVTVTADGKTWAVTLGTEPPDTADRTYTLYANNYYTFTLNLK